MTTKVKLTKYDDDFILISNEAPPRPGGAGMVVETFKKQNITYISSDITNYLVHIKKLKIFKYLWLSELSVKLIQNKKKFNGKTVIINDFGALISYFLVRKIIQFKEKNHKVVYIHHGLTSEANTTFRRQKQILLEKILDQISAAEIAVSDFVRSRLTKRRNVKTMHIPAFLIDYQAIDQLNTKVNAGDRLIFFCACRINEKKITEIGLRFLDQIGQKISKTVVLNLAGAGNTNFLNQLEKLCAELSHIELNIMGPIDRVAVQRSIMNADIVLNMSTLYEGAPTIGYEAALLNRPYMFLDRGGHIETAKYNRRGYISVPEFNERYVSQTKDKILKILLQEHVSENKKLPNLDETFDELIAIIKENNNEN